MRYYKQKATIHINRIALEMMRKYYKELHFLTTFPDRKNTHITDEELVNSMLRRIFQNDYYKFYAELSK